MDVRQSPEYARYLELLGWKIKKINSCQIFIRYLPLLGSIIKIQRPEKILHLSKFWDWLKHIILFKF